MLVGVLYGVCVGRGVVGEECWGSESRVAAVESGSRAGVNSVRVPRISVPIDAGLFFEISYES